LVRVLKDHLAGTPHARLECRSSPYYQNTALYPVIDMCQRVLRWHIQDTPEEKLRKLEADLTRFSLPLDETVPLLAALLGLPLPTDRYRPLTLTPQRQRQKTLEAFTVLLLEQITLEPMLFIVEDLHWSDPSTLELLTLLIDHAPVTQLLILLTCRPEFQPPWGPRDHVTEMTLNRLSHPHVQQLITQLSEGKALPPSVVQQIITQSDGVPLFVEEITKATLESNVFQETPQHYELLRDLPSLAIPATLQDIVMARLDRLPTAKGVAQLGATIGREFSYGLLRLLSPLSEVRLQGELARLVEADLLHQRGQPPLCTYTFKHVLIQEAAYQSLLHSTRQRHHRKIAEALETQYAEMAETHPELVAHHYTEAGLLEQAIVYWRRAGRRAVGRSAYAEGIAHLRKGLELLQSLPETPERTPQELGLLTTLGPALMTVKGYGAAEVEQTYARARLLCQRMGDTPRLLPVLLGLGTFHLVRAEYQMAQEVGEQVLRLAQQDYDPGRLLQAQLALATVLLMRGEPAAALDHLQKGMAFDDVQSVPTRSAPGVSDPRMACRAFASLALWHLGYPDQARQHSHEALRRAEALQHPISVAAAQAWMATTSHYLREVQSVRERAAAAMALASEQGVPSFAALATVLHGWALAMQGDVDRGLPELYQGLDAYQAAGGQVGWSLLLALLAEALGASHKPEEGLRVLEQALTHGNRTGERWWEAELYRRKGELLLALSAHTGAAAEGCFRHALECAHSQRALSWELRAAMSLSRLWHQRDKRAEAHQLLAEVYGRFTEGFDTADVQEANTLLKELQE
jgi:predicted ATPase